MVTANCWKSVPVMPGSSREGRNTAASTKMSIRDSVCVFPGEEAAVPPP